MTEYAGRGVCESERLKGISPFSFIFGKQMF